MRAGRDGRLLRVVRVVRVRACPTCLLEEEQATEEPDPDDVDEVPVVADPLHDGELTRVASGVTLHSPEEEDHGHQAEEHVEPVQARHDEEQRTVGVRVPAGGEEEPLGELVAEKRRTQDQRHHDPAPG